ncbi:MAG TPA: DUF4190 domain-containing protein [Candidatus Lumbricidophila sp.]|nr:DUF4190 domain-containing protein [Candidatus Lumbricidophila sp.]
MSNVPQPPTAGAPEGQPAYQAPPAGYQAPAAGYQAPPAGYQPPAYPAGPGYAAAPTSVPGKGLSIAGLILAFLAPLALIGLILSIVGRVQAKKAGAPTGIATAGIIVSIVVMVFTAIIFVVAGASFVALFSQCAELGQGVHQVGGITVSCG